MAALSLTPFAIAVAALIVGSFLGVVIDRLPRGEGWALGRSHCRHCDTALTSSDLVPIVSWALARGRCRHCGRAIGLFYPAVELASLAVALSALIAIPAHDLPLVVFSLLLGWSLLALAWIDWRHFILPDALTLPLIAAGLAMSAWIAPENMSDHVIGAAAGYGGFVTIEHLYRRLRGRDGLGRGDAKLMAAGGAWLSWAGLPSVLLLASLGGIVLWLAMSWRRDAAQSLQRPLPFGPALAGAIWIVWLLGPLDFAT